MRWNLRKDYVGKLAAAGVRVPQPHIVACEPAAIAKVFDDAGWDQAVVKPASGASGHSVELVKRATLLKQIAGLSDEARASGVVVQEFLPEIAESELSLVYVDGVFSHAIRKRPPPGEFRNNARYGPMGRRRAAAADGLLAAPSGCCNWSVIERDQRGARVVCAATKCRVTRIRENNGLPMPLGSAFYKR